MITAIQTFLFVGFLVLLWMRFRFTLPSISESWYRLPRKIKWIFTIWCFAIGFLMLFQTNGESPLFFLSGAGMCFCGAAPAFRQDLTSTVHTTGAYAAFIFALAGLWIERDCMWPTAGAVISLLTIYYLWKTLPNKTYWTEVAVGLWLMAGLIFS